MQNNLQIEQLIANYLSGNATDAEVRQLEDWVLQSAENKHQFQTSKKAWMLSNRAQTITDAQVDSNWKSISGELFEEPKVVPMPKANNFQYLLRFAAALLLTISVGWWMMNSGKTESPLAVQTTDVSKNFDLPDGSNIVLNNSSELSYDPQKENRKVTLDGDAFFDVKRDETRPFIIDAGGVEVEVLGTSFYVDSREDESTVQVKVASGKVAVRSAGKEQILEKGESAIFEKTTQKLTKESINDKNFDFLKTKTLSFEATPMSEVVYELNRFYNSKIEIEDGALIGCELTGTYKNKSFESILKIIEKTLSIESTATNNGIKFRGNCEE